MRKADVIKQKVIKKCILVTWIILSPGCSNFDAGPSGCTLVTNIPFNNNKKDNYLMESSMHK